MYKSCLSKNVKTQLKIVSGMVSRNVRSLSPLDCDPLFHDGIFFPLIFGDDTINSATQTVKPPS